MTRVRERAAFGVGAFNAGTAVAAALPPSVWIAAVFNAVLAVAMILVGLWHRRERLNAARPDPLAGVDVTAEWNVLVENWDRT